MSESETACRFGHFLADGNLERTTLLACAALDAFGGMVCQHRIMFPYGFRDFGMRRCKVQELVDICNLDAFGARGAVATVHALSAPRELLLAG